MNAAFHFVYLLLMKLVAITGLSYNEINVIVYYWLIPAILLFLVDRIIKKYVFSACLWSGWILLLLLVGDFSGFANQIFDASVVFLLAFRVVGWNYVVASVVVCAVMPALAFVVLLPRAFPRLRRRRVKTGVAS